MSISVQWATPQQRRPRCPAGAHSDAVIALEVACSICHRPRCCLSGGPRDRRSITQPNGAKPFALILFGRRALQHPPNGGCRERRLYADLPRLSVRRGCFPAAALLQVGLLCAAAATTLFPGSRFHDLGVETR